MSVIKNALFSLTRTKVDIDRVRCIKTRVSVQEGYGGKYLEDFPPFTFFSQYVDGDREAAWCGFEGWYYDQFKTKRYFMIPKSDGGFFHGDLYRKVVKAQKENGIRLGDNLENMEESLLKYAIGELIKQRFALCESIMAKGYKVARDDFIICTYHHGLLYLTRGHHRTCILKKLGSKNIPGVILIPQMLYKPIMNIYRRSIHPLSHQLS